MTEYEEPPGQMFYYGEKFVCPCGNGDFRVEIGSEPRNFLCNCGIVYTEQMVVRLKEAAEVG